MKAVTLWRATSEDAPHLGRISWWAPGEANARRYLRMRGFGGPALYRATIIPAARLALGRHPDDVWPTLRHETGIDRSDYEPGELDHEIVWSLADLFSALGYEWVSLPVRHPDGIWQEWLYVAAVPLSAIRI